MADKLYFYSGSKKVPAGRGKNEVVTSTYDLPLDFRQQLSNFYSGRKFPYNGRWYRSIENAFQATKFARAGYPEIARKFEDEHDWSTGEQARANRKAVNLPKEFFSDWNQMEVLADIAHSYYQSEEACEFLRKTKNAELWHVVPRGKPVRFTFLEEIRSRLQ